MNGGGRESVYPSMSDQTWEWEDMLSGQIWNLIAKSVFVPVVEVCVVFQCCMWNWLVDARISRLYVDSYAVCVVCTAVCASLWVASVCVAVHVVETWKCMIRAGNNLFCLIRHVSDFSQFCPDIHHEWSDILSCIHIKLSTLYFLHKFRPDVKSDKIPLSTDITMICSNNVWCQTVIVNPDVVKECEWYMEIHVMNGRLW